MNRHERPRRGVTSKRTGPASSSVSTASTSAVCTAPAVPFGNSPPSTSAPRSPWADLVACPSGQPSGVETSRLVDRVARELRQAGWRLERVLTDNGQEWRSERLTQILARHGARVTRIRAGRPQSNGAVEALHRLILEECWKPAFARYLYLRFHGLRRELDAYLRYYNHDRTHNGRLTRGRIPADIVYGARKMEPR
jgi:Integrase core domain